MNVVRLDVVVECKSLRLLLLLPPPAARATHITRQLLMNLPSYRKMLLDPNFLLVPSFLNL